MMASSPLSALEVVVTVEGAVAMAAAAGWLTASAFGVSADVAVRGSFLATKDCPAFQSFRKATDPGIAQGIKAHAEMHAKRILGTLFLPPS
jgi:hypothetical protein